MSNTVLVSIRQGTITTYRALASERRQALLDLLQREARPIDALEAGRSIGLHRNTARVHLDLLVSSNLVERIVEERTIPGRPRVLYRALSDTPDDSDQPASSVNYRDLARLLASQLSEQEDVREIALRTGQRWASALEADSLPSSVLSFREAVEVVSALLEKLGFEAEPGRDSIRLHRCPFADVAKEHRSVVCGMHLGMLTSTFEQLRTTVSVVGLDSFVSEDPLLCVVHLKDTSGAERAFSGALTETDQP